MISIKTFSLGSSYGSEISFRFMLYPLIANDRYDKSDFFFFQAMKILSKNRLKKKAGFFSEYHLNL